MKSVIIFSLIGALLTSLIGIQSVDAQNCESRFMEAFKKEAANVRLNEAITAYNSLVHDKGIDKQVRERAIERLEACYFRMRYQAEIEFRSYLTEKLETLRNSFNRVCISVMGQNKSVKSF